MQNKRPSKVKAINAKCRECIYDPVSGTGNWRQQVEACTSTSCPLYAVRPLSSVKKAHYADDEALPRTIIEDKP